MIMMSYFVELPSATIITYVTHANKKKVGVESDLILCVGRISIQDRGDLSGPVYSEGTR